MRYSILSAIAIGSSVISAAPAPARSTLNYDAPPGGDVTILSYALTLEYLERKFYMEGLQNFTQAQFVAAGFPDPFYANLKEIYYDEKVCILLLTPIHNTNNQQVHVDTLAGALTAAGATPVTEAMYNFGAPKDPKAFIGLASVLEGVGVSAYLGAAAAIVEKAYLTVAGSILTVESRHSAYIRASLKQSPFPKPFDTPLDFNQVFSLAAQFITGFAPGAAPLPFQAFPPLVLQPSQYPYTSGASPVTFTNGFVNARDMGLVADAHTPVYAVFFSGLDTYYVRARITSTNKDYKIDTIPAGGNGQLPAVGQVYVVLSTADGVNTKVRDENTISGVGVLEVEPPRK